MPSRPAPHPPVRRRKARVSRLLAGLLAAWCGPATLALAQVAPNALPAGGRIVVGSGQLRQDGNVLVVRQGSARLGLDWQSFNIGSAATVEFRQPGSDSIALNRVVGNGGSEIYGRLSANGQVFLTNPNGVLFAPGAKVDVGGLVATTLDLSQQDFASSPDGRFVFANPGAGSVVNQGSLRATAGGYLALFANRVDNTGEITVDAGSVVLASGRAATVSISGSGLISAVVAPGAAGSVLNAGSIAADGGTVTLTASSAEGIAASLVNNTGIVRANTLVQRGGEVWITGDQVATSGRISADAASGDAGRVNVIGNLQHSRADVAGTISARSLDGSGAGGQVETSAAFVAVKPDARVDTRGKAAGTWTIDPTDFTIAAGAGGQSTSGIGADTLATNLTAGNVTLVTAAAGSEPGDIHVQAPVAWSANTVLTLQAARDINVNAAITASGNTAGIVFTPNTAQGGGALKLNTVGGVRSKVTLSGTSPTLTIAGVSYTVVNTLSALQAIGNTQTTANGNYALGSDIDAAATAQLNGGAGFLPIGTAAGVSAFGGRLQGLSHDIANLWVQRNQAHTGLFGVLQGATVANLTLSNASVQGAGSVGLLASQANVQNTTPSVISNVAVSGAASTLAGASTNQMGLLVGWVNSATLSNVLASGSATAASVSSPTVGGLLGRMSGGSLTDASAAVAVQMGGASGSAGGLVGDYSAAQAIVRASASGNVTATGSNQNTGGLIGHYNSSATLDGAQASGAVSGNSRTGGLVGYLDLGSIANVTVSGNVSGTSYTGGVVGYHDATTATISGATVTGNVSGRDNVGGIAGWFDGARISASTVSGKVSAVTDGTFSVGGIAGQIGTACYYAGTCASTYTLADVHVTGAVSGDASSGYAGGLVGFSYGGSIGQSTATGAVSAKDGRNATSTGFYTGGLVGYQGYYSSDSRIVDSSASGAVSGGYYAGGLAGWFNGGAITNSSASGAVSGVGYVGGVVGYGSFGAELNTVSASGAVTATGNAVQSVGGLIGEARFNAGAALVRGVASGNVTAPTARGQVGGLVGDASWGSGSTAAPINDSSASGDVTGGLYTGGLAGQIINGTGYGGVVNSRASGKVSGDTYAGGLVGYYAGTGGSGSIAIANSSASGSVGGTRYVGGLVGYYDGRVGIADSWATGSVSGTGTGTNGTQYLGGLAGYFYGRLNGSTSSTIRGSYATGRVGLAANLASAGAAAYAGGLVGFLGGDTSNNGASDAYASGAVALSSTAGQLFAGGLVGYHDRGSVTRAYATGAVSASGGSARATGGLVAARNAGTVASSVWDSSTTGQAASLGGGTALASAQMRQAASYTGWDIATNGAHTSLWRIYEGSTAPLLTGFLTPLTLTLANASKTYDGNTSFGNAALTSNGSPVSNADRIFTAASSPNVGNYAVGAAGVYSVQNGYDLTVTGSATLTITPRALTLAGFVADKVYDGTRTATLVAAAQPAGLVAGEDLGVNTAGVSALFDTRNAGTGKTVTISGLALADGTRGKASNYTLANSSTTTASITPAPLNVGGFSATSRAYDGSTTVAVAAATPGATPAGVLGSDNVQVDVSNLSGTVASRHAGTGKAVTVLGAALGGNDAANYRIAGIDTVTVDITPKALTVNGLAAPDKTYDASVNVPVNTAGAVLAGVVPGDAVQLQQTQITGATADKNVGSARTVNVSGLALRGDDAADYSAAVASTTVNVLRRPVNFNIFAITGTSRVYDGSTAAVVGSQLVSIYGNDNVTVSFAAPTFADKNAGTGKTVTATGAVLAGTDAANYVLSNTSDTLSATISPKPLTVTGISAVNRAYDGTRDVSVNIGSAAVDTSAVIGGDQVGVSVPGTGTVTGQVATKDVGNAKAVALAGFGLTGADAGNYTLGGSGGLTVNITKKDLTAVYTTIDKVYDGNAFAALNVTTADVVSGDLNKVFFYADNGYCTTCGYGYFATATSTPTTYAVSRDAGTNKTVVVTTNSLYGSEAGNYNLVNPTAVISGNITPRGITPVYTGGTKVYDGNATAPVSINANASQIVSGDTVSVTQTAVFTAGKDVGTGKAVAISNIAFSGAAAGNYTLASTTASTTASITAKPVSLTGVTATNRAYDGSTVVALTAGSFGLAGTISGDTVGVVPPTGGFATGSIANKNAGTGKVVAIAGVTFNGTDGGNYVLAADTGVRVDIAPKALTAAYSGQTRVYNGGIGATVTASSADVVAGDTITFSQNAVFTGLDARNVGSNKPISVTGITIGGADAANYALVSSSASTTGGITPKALTVAFVGIDRVYNGLADRSASVDARLTGVVPGDLVGTTQAAQFAGDGAAGSNKAVNVTGIALAGGDAANYSLAATGASTTATINRRPIGLAGVSATDRVYDGSTVVSVNTAGATIDASSVITGDQVVLVLPPGGITAGQLTQGRDAGLNRTVGLSGVTLTGTSAANYTAVGATGLTVNIAPRQVTGVYTAADRAYNGLTGASIGASLAGVLAIDLGTVGLSASGNFADKNAGSGKTVLVGNAFLTGSGQNNYALASTSGSTTATITPKTLTATYLGVSKVYDGSAVAPVASNTAGIITGDDLGFTQTAAYTGGKNVGNAKAIAVSDIALTGGDRGNYRLQATTAATSGNVTPKPITIDGLLGATATDRVYDGTPNVAVTVSTSGSLAPSSNDIVAGDTVTIALPTGGITSGTATDKNAGRNKAVRVNGLSLGGADAPNYTVAATSGVTVNITPKPVTAVYSGVTRVYDGSTAATATGSSADILAADRATALITASGVFTGTGARNAGTGKAMNVFGGRLDGGDAGNYALLNDTGSTTATVTPKPITASYATNVTKVYDGGVAAPVVSNTAGFVAGDDIGLTQTATFSDKNAGTNKAVAVRNIALAGSDRANYSLVAASVNTTGGITPKPLRIDGLTGVSATNRVYDGTTLVQVVVTASGPIAPNPADVIAGDVVGVNAPPTGVTTGTLASKNAGLARPVAVTGLNLTGADAANYSVAATSGVTVDIAPRPITATYTGIDKVYDGTAAATLLGSSSGIIAGDSLVIGGSGVFSGGKNVGTAKAISVTGGSLSGADATNYSLLNPGGSASASITPRSVTASYSGGTRIYDGTTGAPVTANAPALVAGDSVTLTQTASFADKNVGSGKGITVTSIALTGTDAANYALTATSATTSGSITPRPLRIDGLSGAVATDRIYDGSTTVAVVVNSLGPVTPNSNDLISGDVVTVAGGATGSTTGTMRDKNAGNAKPVTISGLTLAGADAGNYVVSSASGVTVNIAPRPLTAVYSGADKVYDGSAVATVAATAADIVAGDALNIGATGVFTGGKNVGSAKAVAITGGALSGADAANYLLRNADGSATASITPKSVNPLYQGVSRIYDGSTAAAVTSVTTDFITGDAVTLTQSATFTGTGAKNAGDGKTIEVSGIALAGADAGNYVLGATRATTTGSITPRPLSVSGLQGLAAVNRDYDGTRAVQITASGTLAPPTLADVISGDEVSVSLAGSATTGTMLDKNAGRGKAVVVDGLQLAGADRANYTIAGTVGLSVDISPRLLDLRGITTIDRLYDGSTLVALDTSRGTLSGMLAGDNVSLPATAAAGRMTDRHAGSGKAVTVSGLALAGPDGANYAARSVDALSVNIAPRPLAVTATGVDRVYDGSTGARVVLAGNALAGDSIVLTPGSATSAGRNVGTFAVAVSGITLGGADAADYTLDNTGAATTASILPRPLTVTPSVVTRLIGESAPTSYAFSTNPDGLVAGDSVTAIAVASPSLDNLPAGSVIPLRATGASFGASTNASNYAIAYGTGLLLILPRQATTSTGGSSDGTAFALSAEAERLAQELPAAQPKVDAVVLQAQAGPAPAAPGVPQNQREASAEELAVLLSLDSRQLTVPALQKLPLLSVDPQLLQRRPGARPAPVAPRP